jgi:predicted outer membrane lipoprotein
VVSRRSRIPGMTQTRCDFPPSPFAHTLRAGPSAAFAVIGPLWMELMTARRGIRNWIVLRGRDLVVVDVASDVGDADVGTHQRMCNHQRRHAVGCSFAFRFFINKQGAGNKIGK